MFQETINLGTMLGVGTIITTIVGATWKLRDWIQKIHDFNLEKFYRLEIRLARIDAMLGLNGHSKNDKQTI